MNRLIAFAAAAAAIAVSPVMAEEKEFDETIVAAMKDGIVIEAPWAVSMKDDELIVFMLIHNSAETDTIKSVSSEIAEDAHMAKFEAPGMQKPETLETLNTPGGEATSLDQDGYHLNLSGLKGKLKNGDIVPVTLSFEETGDIEVQVSVAIPQ